jgi:hypothetical protein
MTPAALQGLHGLVGVEGGLLADALVDAAPPDGDVFGPLVAAGERVGEAAGEYALLVESIFEGYLLHYGGSRIVASPDDDLLLLSGDYFYALGLSRLAAIGDLEAIEELADLITLCAQAHAGGNGGDDADATVVTGGLWALSALAVAAGPWAEQQQAKQRTRRGEKFPSQDLRAIAQARAVRIGLELRLHQALIAFDRTVNV